MDKLISLQDAIKAIDEKAKRIKNEDTLNGLAGAVGILFDLPSYNSVKTELSGDVISRQAALEIFTWTNTKEDIWYGLKQLPTVAIPSAKPCEDAISREDAIKALSYGEGCRNVCANAIRRLPSVTQEPKTGHWKRISMDKYSEHAKYWYRCDRCGKDNLGNTDWCPNCGCRMVEPQEGAIRNDTASHK